MSIPTGAGPKAPAEHEFLVSLVDEAFAPVDGVLARRPGHVSRPSQRELAHEVAATIASRGTLVAEAGTGTGKTYAYLVPVLLSGARTLISTASRYLQDQLVERDIPALAALSGVTARVAVLKGRSNYVCRHHLERNLREGRFERREDHAVLEQIRRFAALSSSGDRAHAAGIPEDAPAWALAVSTRENCLGQECPHFEDCFLMQARRRALQADIVVVNHHLFCADLALRDDGISELLPLTEAIVFDEAHQLPDIATQFFGTVVSTRQIVELGRDLVRIGRADAPDACDWLAAAAGLETGVRELRLHAGRPGRLDDRQLREMGSLQAAIEGVASAIEAVQPVLSEAGGRSRDLERLAQRSAALARQLRGWLGALRGEKRDTDRADAADDRPDPASGADGDGEVTDDGPVVLWADVRQGGLALHATPLSVAGPFQRQREASRRAWVFVSATLSVGGRFTHFQRALGLADAVSHCWPSPFDYRRNTRLLVPESIVEPSDPGFASALAAEVAPLIAANRGRAFVLCTSLRMVARMAELLAQELGETVELLVQGRAPRMVLIERFRRAAAPVLVGSASFWAGVDVPGEQLSLVVIDKLPFAPPDDPIVRARADALRLSGGDPFRELQLPAAAMLLKQGAGRLVRAEADEGLLVIGDRRLVSRPYGKTLLASLPDFPLIRSREQALAFIARRAAGPVVEGQARETGSASEASPASGPAA